MQFPGCNSERKAKICCPVGEKKKNNDTHSPLQKKDYHFQITIIYPFASSHIKECNKKSLKLFK